MVPISVLPYSSRIQVEAVCQFYVTPSRANHLKLWEYEHLSARHLVPRTYYYLLELVMKVHRNR